MAARCIPTNSCGPRVPGVQFEKSFALSELETRQDITGITFVPDCGRTAHYTLASRMVHLSAPLCLSTFQAPAEEHHDERYSGSMLNFNDGTIVKSLSSDRHNFLALSTEGTELPSSSRTSPPSPTP